MDKRPKSVVSSRGVHSSGGEKSKVNLLNSVQFQNPNLRQLDKVFKRHISTEQNRSSQSKRNEKQKFKESKDDVTKSLQSQVKSNLKNQKSAPQIDIKKIEQPQIEVRRPLLDSQNQRNKNLEENLLQKIQNRKILDQLQIKSTKAQKQLQTEESKKPLEKLDQKENQQNVDTEQVPCILDYEDFPIIPEVHHLTGRCYCDYCTCGNHFCPSITIRGLYSQSTFRTQYQKFYQGKKQNYPLLKTDREKYVKIEMPSDYKTIKQQDYDNIIEKLRKSAESGFQISKSPNNSEQKKEFEPKFLGTTSNQYFYPN